jgi:hypothetical protein
MPETMMTEKKKVLLIGLDPSVVEYAKWPGLTPEKLEGGLRRDVDALEAQGIDAEICFIDHGEKAEATVRAALAKTPPHCVLIGAGVRTDPDEFLMFERLVNVLREAVPDCPICFNTGPTDSVDAVRRHI